MHERRFSDGDYLFRSGDAADGVFRLVSGSVRAVGDAGPVSGFAPGDLIGEEGFLFGDERAFGAAAVGDVVVEFLRRNEVLQLLSDRPDRLTPLLRDLFGPRDSDVPRAAGNGAVQPDPEPDPYSVRPLAPHAARIKIIPDGRRVRDILGTDDVPVQALPFCIGRTASGEGMTTYNDVTLSLTDTRPFNLSRRHFSIDRDDVGGLIVRDHGSYHGTMVNGLLLGGDGHPQSAPLLAGDNQIVAGRSDSPYRFRILVG